MTSGNRDRNNGLNGDPDRDVARFDPTRREPHGAVGVLIAWLVALAGIAVFLVLVWR